jgi:alpha-L-rhamnosidase
VLRRVIEIKPGTTPDGVLSASFYFRFYLSRALQHAGMGDEYLRSLDPWRALLPLHFSTWPETPEPTRSDSHAWSAHPAYDLLTLVAGIQPASPGFGTVRIEPHLGSLPELTATYPHPMGMIQVRYRKTAAGLEAFIQLPEKLSGEFVYDGDKQPLHPGDNHFEGKAPVHRPNAK